MKMTTAGDERFTFASLQPFGAMYVAMERMKAVIEEGPLNYTAEGKRWAFVILCAVHSKTPIAIIERDHRMSVIVPFAILFHPQEPPKPTAISIMGIRCGGAMMEIPTVTWLHDVSEAFALALPADAEIRRNTWVSLDKTAAERLT